LGISEYGVAWPTYGKDCSNCRGNAVDSSTEDDIFSDVPGVDA
jgi:hypothetical protein